jgi:hypothetical protein
MLCCHSTCRASDTLRLPWCIQVRLLLLLCCWNVQQQVCSVGLFIINRIWQPRDATTVARGRHLSLLLLALLLCQRSRIAR